MAGKTTSGGGGTYLSVRWEAVRREKWLWCSRGGVRACQSSRRKACVWVRKEVVSVVNVWTGEEAASGCMQRSWMCCGLEVVEVSVNENKRGIVGTMVYILFCLHTVAFARVCSRLLAFAHAKAGNSLFRYAPNQAAAQQ